MTRLTFQEQINHDKALQVSKVFKTSELELIDLLKHADELGYFKKLGFGSLYEYAHLGLGLSEAVSYNLMAIARKSRKVPELQTALESGSITVSNAKLLVSVITPENKDHWISLAQELPKPKLEREIVKVSPRAAVQERASVVSEDVMKIVMALSNESHEILKRVLDLESQRQGKAATYDDAIRSMGEVYLKIKDPIQKAKRAEERASRRDKAKSSGRKVETKSIAHSTSQSRNSSSGTVNENSDSPQSAVSSIKSGASNTVDEAALRMGIPFVRHPLPAKLRHQITIRDQARCTHLTPNGQRCESQRWLDIHHKIPISHGGTNDLQNLSMLCHSHHLTRHQ